jgi:hypothetical protein
VRVGRGALLERAYSGCRGQSALDTALDEKKKRDELKVKRNLLFDEYLKKPWDTRLALEIKVMDDQVAESIALTERKPTGRK